MIYYFTIRGVGENDGIDESNTGSPDYAFLHSLNFTDLVGASNWQKQGYSSIQIVFGG